MSSDPAPRWEPLDDHLLKEIYDSDQAMYPAPELSYARLKSWAAACPELCLALRSEPSTTSEADETVQGLIIVLPLRQPSWDRLRLAEISEHDVDAASMFPPSVVDDSVAEGGDEEKAAVGLHVFHIERFPGFVEVWKESKFTALALEEIRCRVADLFKAWHVVGYSALTATKQGSAALKRLGFSPGDTEAGIGNRLLTDEAQLVERLSNGPFLTPHPPSLKKVAG